MTAREAVNAMFRHLRREQRRIPCTDTTYDDPLPDAIDSINAALQQMAVLAPLFAVKQQRSVWFHAPATVSVSGLTIGGMTATATWPAWAAGCQIALPGDLGMNRILSIDATTATLHFPYMGAETTGNATLNADSADLAADIITVLEPVRPRGSRTTLLPAGGRDELATGCGNDARYFIESTMSHTGVQLRMMLSGSVSADTVIEFQARTVADQITQADIYDAEDIDAEAEVYTPPPDPGTPLPIMGGFVESIFLPMATNTFFSKPCITNFDINSTQNTNTLKTIREQAAQAIQILEQMRPQGRKPARLMPGWG